MAGNPYFQNLDPMGAPDPVTPSDAASNPPGYAKVTPAGDGPAPAPYDISAPQDIAGIAAATEAAMALSGGGEGADTGAGLPNRNSPRQQETAAILDSPQGAQSSNVFSGFPDYENADLRPASDLDVPIQGEMGTYPAGSTSQDGIPQFTAGAHAHLGATIPGVPPEAGDMGPSKGMDYPGTSQPDTEKYGTS